MIRFYFLLWLHWVGVLLLQSIGSAFLLTLIFVAWIYFSKDVALNKDVIDALVSLFSFWFWVIWSATFVASLFFAFKSFFNHCYAGYVLKVIDCNSHVALEHIGYSDLIQIWRKWLMLLIWITAFFIIVLSILLYALFEIQTLFSWLNLTIMIVLAICSAFFALFFLRFRTQKIRVERC